MQVIRMTARAKDWLMTTDQFCILHHFDDVCNLINESNQVLAVHTQKIGMGPFSCQIEPKLFQQIKSTDDIRLYPSQNSFSINGHFITVENLSLWNPRPNWGTFSRHKLVEIPHKISDKNASILGALHTAIIQDKHAIILGSARQLAGRGIGLTPQGDDLLIGTIFALHMLGWEQNIIEMLGEQPKGQTGSLSAAFLQAAVAGEATEPWHQLLAGEPNALENLLSVGETSGKDAWFGFVNMIQKTFQVLKS